MVDISAVSPAPPDTTSDALVELRGVDKHFGPLHVLQHIDLTVRRGEVVVVIGPSGSGKSTLCRTINRLETIDSGTISLDGQPLPAEGRALARLRADVGMVFQSFNLFAHKTVLQNVVLGQVKAKGVKPAKARGDRARPPRPRRRRGTRPTSSPPSCPAVSSSGSPSRAPWPCSRRSCSSTSRRRRSTPR